MPPADRSRDHRGLRSYPGEPASPYRVRLKPAPPTRARETLRCASGGRCCAAADVPGRSPPRADCRPCWPSVLSLGLDLGELYRKVRRPEFCLLRLVSLKGGLGRFEQRSAVFAREETAGDDRLHARPHAFEDIVQFGIAKDRCL